MTSSVAFRSDAAGHGHGQPDETDGKVLCLVEAPDAAAAEQVHKEAHGRLADHLYPVVEGS